jgi:hypothetical protein
MTEAKARLYSTARATVACAYFKAGDFVGVSYQRTENGTHWFEVTSQSGEKTYYPQHHLTEFCL